MQGYRIYRHYDMESETFTGGDSLLTAIQLGWSIYSIAPEMYELRGRRSTTIYHFGLTRQGDTMVMSVVACPFVAQLIAPILLHQTPTLPTIDTQLMPIVGDTPAHVVVRQ